MSVPIRPRPASTGRSGSAADLPFIGRTHIVGGMEAVFLVGPTAVGKSAVALELARLLDAPSSLGSPATVEIVSADSMQVYRGMDIGTAKPSLEERRLVPHHLIDVADIAEAFDVKQYVTMAASRIASIAARTRTPVVVGGTGLYVRALRRGLFEGPPRDESLRARFETMPADALFAELQRVDPQTAGTIDRRNPRRLVRALEVFYLTGRSIREFQTQWNVERASNPFASGAENRRDARFTHFCLNRPRPDLYARIERRIDEQIAAGWVDEVKGLLERGLEKNTTVMQAAGYRELAAHVRGELTLAEAVALIKTRTRQLARRQLTWFRREPDLNWIDIARDETPGETARRVWDLLKEHTRTIENV